MSRQSFVDRAFYVALTVLLSVLGVYLDADSLKNRGFELSRSVQFLAVLIFPVLAALGILRRREGGKADDDPQADE